MGLRSGIIRLLGQKALTAAVDKAIREATSDGRIDPDDDQWNPIGGATTRRDLLPFTHDRAIEFCFELYQKNPLGHRITELNRDYVVGDGITTTIRNPDVEEVVTEFWQDEVNNLDQRLSDFALELGLYGELVPEAFTGDISGVTQLGYIDPAQIKKVVPLPDNPLVPDVLYVRKKGFGHQGEPKQIIRDRGNGRLEGDVFFFSVNSVSNSTRGWPDLLHIADWLNSYDEFLWEILERARLTRIFIWDVAIEGDQIDIDAWARKHGKTPKSGSVLAHNANEKWTPLAPNLGSFEAAKAAEVLIEQISAGSGFPKHWLSSPENVNRATATEMGGPTIRRLAHRQRYFTHCVARIVRYVCEQAIEAGRLQEEMPAYDDEDKATDEKHAPWELVNIQAPEIFPKDLAAAGQLLDNVVSAIAVAKGEGWIDDQTNREVLAQMLQQLGVDYDPAMAPEPEQPPQIQGPGGVPQAVDPKALQALAAKLAGDPKNAKATIGNGSGSGNAG